MNRRSIDIHLVTSRKQKKFFLLSIFFYECLWPNCFYLNFLGVARIFVLIFNVLSIFRVTHKIFFTIDLFDKCKLMDIIKRM